MGLMLFTLFFMVVIFKILQDSIKWLSEICVRVWLPASKSEWDMQQQVIALQKEKQTINMTDEFARYAKLDRKINKFKEEIQNNGKQRQDVAFKLRLVIKVIVQVFQILLYLTLVWRWRSFPLVEMPSNWLWPLASFIAFPSGIPGAVGVTCWLLICRTVVTKGAALLQPV